MRRAILAAVLLAAAGQAQAASITHAAGFNTGQHQFSSVPMFDPSLGTLTSVDFAATGGLTAAFRLSSADPISFPAAGTFRQTWDFALAPNPFPGPSTQFTYTESSDYAATSSFPTIADGLDFSRTLTTALDRFYGPGRFDLLAGVSASLSIPGVSTTTTFVGASGSATVTYNYDPPGVIPEPASLAMLPLGLVVVARLARRRRAA